MYPNVTGEIPAQCICWIQTALHVITSVLNMTFTSEFLGLALGHHDGVNREPFRCAA